MHEPWIERVIREAQEAGEFDDVAGTGEPIPDIGRPYEPGWWARRWIARERQRETTTELARAIEQELPRVLAGTVEQKTRSGLESLNTKIKEHNERAPTGNDLPLLDVDRLLQEWAQRRGK
jgi:hypothetical protein